MCPPNPGKLYGCISQTDHAINFALDRLEPWETWEFLKDYRENNLEPWPEFTDYLARMRVESIR